MGPLTPLLDPRERAQAVEDMYRAAKGFRVLAFRDARLAEEIAKRYRAPAPA